MTAPDSVITKLYTEHPPLAIICNPQKLRENTKISCHRHTGMGMTRKSGFLVRVARCVKKPEKSLYNEIRGIECKRSPKLYLTLW